MDDDLNVCTTLSLERLYMYPFLTSYKPNRLGWLKITVSPKPLEHLFKPQIAPAARHLSGRYRQILPHPIVHKTG